MSDTKIAKTFSFDVTIRKELTAEAVSDVIITAVEGGIGYWSTCSEYKWQDRAYEDIFAVIHDEEDGGKEYTISVATIYQGLKSLLDGTCKIHADDEQIRKMAQDFVLSGDAGEIDAGDADNIVQAGLFNEVRYG